MLLYFYIDIDVFLQHKEYNTNIRSLDLKTKPQFGLTFTRSYKVSSEKKVRIIFKFVIFICALITQQLSQKMMWVKLVWHMCMQSKIPTSPLST